MRLRVPADLGLALQQARLARGMTQRKLAETLGIAQRSVSEIESGRPTIYLRKMFEILRETGAELTATWDDGEEADDGQVP
jgi:HTH-type transcriptional regulator/antitoxin HipB